MCHVNFNAGNKMCQRYDNNQGAVKVRTWMRWDISSGSFLSRDRERKGGCERENRSNLVTVTNDLVITVPKIEQCRVHVLMPV